MTRTDDENDDQGATNGESSLSDVRQPVERQEVQDVRVEGAEENTLMVLRELWAWATMLPEGAPYPPDGLGKRVLDALAPPSDSATDHP